MTPLNELAYEIWNINRDNGWDVTNPLDWLDERKLAEKLCLIHSEASEALEALRHDDRANFREELADVVIRVLDLASGLDIDMDHEVQKKMDRNRKRGYRHGGKAL